MQLLQCAEPIAGQEPADALRTLAFMANLAAQEATGSLDASRGVNELFDALQNPSPLSRTLIFAITEGNPEPDLVTSELGYPLISSSGEAAEPEAVAWLTVNVPLADNTDSVDASVVLDVDLLAQPGEPLAAAGRTTLKWALGALAEVTQRLNRHIIHVWQQHSDSAALETDGYAHVYRSCEYELALTQSESMIALPVPVTTCEIDLEEFSNTDFPERLVAEVARLYQRASVDQPLGTLAIEEAPWDAARLKVATEHFRTLGTENYHVLAIADNHVVGLSEVWIHAGFSPEVALQGLTYVLPQWRRQGIGRALKTRVLDLVQQAHPQVTRVYTSQAQENTAMATLNRELGSVESSVVSAWQRILVE